MSHNIQISEALRRSIQNGSSFSRFIKETNCNVKSYGNGNNSTTDGVNFMANMIEKSSHQVKELAQKLNKFNLEKTVKSVHSFLVSYIQYEADAQMQRLRSPGCSWSVRQKGIDCKSFTIFACSLLREMGYKSIIRQVKQPSFYANQFTHVYLIVPKNQKITNANQLTDYYNLDGTTLDNREVVFSTKKDKFMNGLRYQGMMGASLNSPSLSKETKESKNFEGSFPQFQKIGFSRNDLIPMKNYMKELQNSRGTSNGMYFVPRPNGILITDAKNNGYLFKPSNIGIWQQYYLQYADRDLQGMNAIGILTAVGGASGLLAKLPVVGDIFGKVFGGLNGLLGGLFGSDRGWYKSGFVKRDGETLISMLIEKSLSINQAVISQNMRSLGEAVASFRLDANIFEKAIVHQINRGWNDPTIDNLNLLLVGVRKIKEQFLPALSSWVSQYYSKSGSSGSKTETTDYLDSFFNYDNPFQFSNPPSHSEPIPNLNLKQGVTSVRSFAIVEEGETILQTMGPSEPIGGSDPQLPPGNGRNEQVANFQDAGVTKASLIPGFSNTAIIATGGVLMAGVLFYPKIKKLLK